MFKHTLFFQIAKIHDIFPTATKDQIAKILQYYEDDENKAVDALTRGIYLNEINVYIYLKAMFPNVMYLNSHFLLTYLTIPFPSVFMKNMSFWVLLFFNSCCI